MRTSFVPGALLFSALWFFGCQSSEAKPTAPAPAPASRELVVFAAASLRDPFTAMAATFGNDHPEAKLTFNFAGSQELRLQVEQGAHADVFAGADHKHVDALEKAGLLAPATVFARNEPVLAVSLQSKQKVASLAELPNVDHIVLGVPEVPIGRYSDEILQRAVTTLGADFKTRVEAKVSSRELNVKQVLAKVLLGEADAAIVYRSDAHGQEGKVQVVSIPAEINVLAEYPMGIVKKTTQPELARAWIDFSLSDAGQHMLHDAGFRMLSETGGDKPTAQ